jgi:multicomponent Na+:H+ antiporter subunit F
MLSLTWPLWIAFATIGLSFILVFVRLVRGPSLPDRVVALDMVSYLSIGLIALWTLVSQQPAYLDAAIVLALIAFLATVAFARYVARQHGEEVTP